MVSAICAIVFALVSLLNAWVIKNIRLEVARLQTSIAHGRLEDRLSLEKWINGSFMRSKEAIARMDAFESRLDSLN
jgi:hypothetical protein